MNKRIRQILSLALPLILFLKAVNNVIEPYDIKTVRCRKGTALFLLV